MKKRIKGIDVARAFAIVGMIIVNFTIVFGGKGHSWLMAITGFLSGKAAATFVVLAGVGLALMSKKAVATQDKPRLQKVYKRIGKRALFLFVVGLSYTMIWPADILHFYGIYMLITLLFLTASRPIILIAASLFILSYPPLMYFMDYEQGWNFETLSYLDFWTLNGFFRNLFYNGFHPVVPWVAFMLMGLWFGRLELRDTHLVQKSMWISLGVFMGIHVLSYGLLAVFSEGNPQIWADLHSILGTSPMPPLPIYMISGCSIAIFTISSCILLANHFEHHFIIDGLYKTGQLALTFYVAHAVIGMGIIEAIDSSKMGQYSIEFSLGYALIFSGLCVVFAVVWRRKKAVGPLEWVMRKLTDG